ncbi:MarR family transcriptional regulator [Bradyrhizobium sp. McL0616]|uniref:MarR family transcriptional regulator n=1 Tax=Bradyrhizobium sp. McL0616 TaxID=3415674 RepID=UPI003CEC4AA2
MPLARQTVDLLIQAAKAGCFEGDHKGLSAREWAALRFVRRANRFSRTPSALADFIGTSRATASQIVKALEAKAYVHRKTSFEDKRSVELRVTAQGEKCLNQDDPINHVVNAVAKLGTQECVKLNFTIKEILNHVYRELPRVQANTCLDCLFLAESNRGPRKGRAATEFMCRRYRVKVSREETELLCISFERS